MAPGLIVPLSDPSPLSALSPITYRRDSLVWDTVKTPIVTTESVSSEENLAEDESELYDEVRSQDQTSYTKADDPIAIVGMGKNLPVYEDLTSPG